jgi:hypothetical protein
MYNPDSTALSACPPDFLGLLDFDGRRALGGSTSYRQEVSEPMLLMGIFFLM